MEKNEEETRSSIKKHIDKTQKENKIQFPSSNRLGIYYVRLFGRLCADQVFLKREGN